jgi:transposase-like protein
LFGKPVKTYNKNYYLEKKLIKNNAISGNMNEKVCSVCKNKQDVENFGKLKSSKDGYRYDCKSCRRKYREENKTAIKEKQCDYYNNHKIELLNKNKEYRKNNLTIINVQRKEYRNRPEIKEHQKIKNKEYLPIRKERIKVLRKTNINFKVSEILRSKIHKMIKGKKTSYQNMIGCDLEFLKKWIEYRFSENMTWSNLGSVWQIDHILPINSFNLNNENEKKICFHWTNLQPLDSYTNQSKSDKLQLHYYFNNIVNVNRFNSKYNQFLGYQTLNESLRWLRDNKLRYGNNPPYKLVNSNEIGNPQPSS